MTVLALTSVYIYFASEMNTKQKRNLENSVNNYKNYLNNLEKINVYEDSAVMAKTKEIQQKQQLLDEQLAKGLISEEEANKRMESLNEELGKVQDLMVTKIKGVIVENERLIYSSYTKDSIISVLLNQPIVDNTDYIQIESIRKKAKIAEEEKGKIQSNLEILSNDFTNTKNQLTLTKIAADSLNKEILKNPRARISISNIRLETITGRPIQARYPNGSNENQVGEIIVIFDVSGQSKVPFGQRTIYVRYMKPDGTVATSASINIDFKGETIRGLRGSIKYPKFPAGINSFQIIDDNLKVGSSSVLFGN
jgi:hypothetical protein